MLVSTFLFILYVVVNYGVYVGGDVDNGVCVRVCVVFVVYVCDVVVGDAVDNAGVCVVVLTVLGLVMSVAFALLVSLVILLVFT